LVRPLHTSRRWMMQLPTMGPVPDGKRRLKFVSANMLAF
jgi:hypothetical protein